MSGVEELHYREHQVLLDLSAPEAERKNGTVRRWALRRLKVLREVRRRIREVERA